MRDRRRCPPKRPDPHRRRPFPRTFLRLKRSASVPNAITAWPCGPLPLSLGGAPPPCHRERQAMTVLSPDIEPAPSREEAASALSVLRDWAAAASPAEIARLDPAVARLLD